MPSDFVVAVLPVVSLAAGAVGGYIADALRDGRLAAREEAAAACVAERERAVDLRAREREEAAYQREQRREHAAWQRETLIELQDWLAKYARAASAIHHADYMNFRESGRWGRDPVGDEWNESFRETTVNVHRFAARVDNNAIRAMVEQCVEAGTGATRGAGHGEDDRAVYADAEQARQTLMEATAAAQEMIGERLRAA